MTIQVTFSTETAFEDTLEAAGLSRLPLRLFLRSNGRHGLFDAYLGDALVCTSHQPLLDGARALLALGYSADLPMTARHEGKGHDSFIPQPIGAFAKLTSDDMRVRFRPYAPYSARGDSPMRGKASDVELDSPPPTTRCARLTRNPRTSDMANWAQSNWSLRALSNRNRSFLGVIKTQEEIDAEEAAREAEEAAQAAAAQARRDADTLAREEDSHTVAHQLKQYRRAVAARASAALAASPPPEPLPAQSVDIVPSPEKIAEAVARLRAPRARAPGGSTGLFGGGIKL